MRQILQEHNHEDCDINHDDKAWTNQAVKDVGTIGKDAPILSNAHGLLGACPGFQRNIGQALLLWEGGTLVPAQAIISGPSNAAGREYGWDHRAEPLCFLPSSDQYFQRAWQKGIQGGFGVSSTSFKDGLHKHAKLTVDVAGTEGCVRSYDSSKASQNSKIFPESKLDLSTDDRGLNNDQGSKQVPSTVAQAHDDAANNNDESDKELEEGEIEADRAAHSVYMPNMNIPVEVEQKENGQKNPISLENGQSKFISYKPKSGSSSGNKHGIHYDRDRLHADRRLSECMELLNNVTVKDAQRSFISVCRKLQRALNILCELNETLDMKRKVLEGSSRKFSDSVHKTFSGIRAVYAVRSTSVGKEQDQNVDLFPRLLELAYGNCRNFFTSKRIQELESMIRNIRLHSKLEDSHPSSHGMVVSPLVKETTVDSNTRLEDLKASTSRNYEFDTKCASESLSSGAIEEINRNLEHRKDGCSALTSVSVSRIPTESLDFITEKLQLHDLIMTDGIDSSAGLIANENLTRADAEGTAISDQTASADPLPEQVSCKLTSGEVLDTTSGLTGVKTSEVNAEAASERFGISDGNAQQLDNRVSHSCETRFPSRKKLCETDEMLRPCADTDVQDPPCVVSFDHEWFTCRPPMLYTQLPSSTFVENEGAELKLQECKAQSSALSEEVPQYAINLNLPHYQDPDNSITVDESCLCHCELPAPSLSGDVVNFESGGFAHPCATAEGDMNLYPINLMETASQLQEKPFQDPISLATKTSEKERHRVLRVPKQENGHTKNQDSRRMQRYGELFSDVCPLDVQSYPVNLSSLVTASESAVGIGKHEQEGKITQEDSWSERQYLQREMLVKCFPEDGPLHLADVGRIEDERKVKTLSGGSTDMKVDSLHPFQHSFEYGGVANVDETDVQLETCIITCIGETSVHRKRRKTDTCQAPQEIPDLNQEWAETISSDDLGGLNAVLASQTTSSVSMKPTAGKDPSKAQECVEQGVKLRDPQRAPLESRQENIINSDEGLPTVADFTPANCPSRSEKGETETMSIEAANYIPLEQTSTLYSKEKIARNNLNQLGTVNSSQFPLLVNDYIIIPQNENQASDDMKEFDLNGFKDDEYVDLTQGADIVASAHPMGSHLIPRSKKNKTDDDCPAKLADSLKCWEDLEMLEGLDEKQLEVVYQERARRIDEQNRMLNSKKLCLVLDLDHTLLNSAKFLEVDEEWEALLHANLATECNRVDVEGLGRRELYRCSHMGMWTKLRPGIWKFLSRASELYELHVYTMGNKAYATEMANLLDPTGTLFAGRVISKGDDGDTLYDDERSPKSKDLDGVLGMESAVIIIDDSVRVWPHHRDNLIVVERYMYFPSSRWQFGLPGPSLLEINHDERETDGMLASVLEVIEKVHRSFFANDWLHEVDVRAILAAEKQNVLAGCKIIFSRVYPQGESQPHLHPLWQLAEHFGAICTTTLDEEVTHVVAISRGTDKVKWALSTGRFSVCPAWLEASAVLYRRATEHDFPVPP